MIITRVLQYSRKPARSVVSRSNVTLDEWSILHTIPRRSRDVLHRGSRGAVASHNNICGYAAAMSVRRCRRHCRCRRHYRYLHEKVFFAVFLLAFVFFGTGTAETTEHSPGDETLRENATVHPETTTSNATDASAVTSTDVFHQTWSAIDYRTVPSFLADDYRTIPSSTRNDYRTIPLSMADDFRTITSSLNDHGQPISSLMPPPLTVTTSQPTETTNNQRPIRRPSAIPAWNRFENH